MQLSRSKRIDPRQKLLPLLRLTQLLLHDAFNNFAPVCSILCQFNHNPSQNILRPTPNGLIFCSFLWKHICSLRKGNNISAPSPDKAILFPNDHFHTKTSSHHTHNIALSGKGAENRCSLRIFVKDCSLFKVFLAFDRSSLIPILLRSRRIVCIHVVFGLPSGLLTFLIVIWLS